MNAWIRRTVQVGIVSAAIVLGGAAAAQAADGGNNVGELNGNSVNAPVQTPVCIAGNASTVIGDANAWGNCDATAIISDGGHHHGHGGGDHDGCSCHHHDGDNNGGGDDRDGRHDDHDWDGGGNNVGFGNGNVLNRPIQAPLVASGNASTVIGDANAHGRGSATAVIH